MTRALLLSFALLGGCRQGPPRFELTEEQRAKVEAALPDERPTPVHVTPVEWDDAIRLIGWEAETERPSPGDEFDLTLAWESRRRSRVDWEVFARLRSTWTGKEALLDHHAVGGLHPIIRWQPGQFVLDPIAVRLPADFPPGPAELKVGLRHWQDRRGPVAVGRLEVQARSRLVLHVPAKTRWRLDDRTRVWAQWHGDGLLFGFDMEDDDPWNPLEGRDAELWRHDVVELFLDVDERDPAYVELQVSPTGALFDASFVDHRSELAIAKRWDSKADVRTWITATGWRAELFVPWSSLPPRPMALSPIRANIYRIDRDRSGRYEATAWSGPSRGDFHDRRRWGRLLLAP